MEVGQFKDIVVGKVHTVVQVLALAPKYFGQRHVLNLLDAQAYRQLQATSEIQLSLAHRVNRRMSTGQDVVVEFDHRTKKIRDRSQFYPFRSVCCSDRIYRITCYIKCESFIPRPVSKGHAYAHAINILMNFYYKLLLIITSY
jgi:hypothetical protein